MKAGELMSSPVVTIGPDTEITKILDILLEKRISGVLVVESGRVVGSVGEGELLHRHEIGTETAAVRRSWWRRLLGPQTESSAYVRSHGEHARDVMDRTIVSVSEETPASTVASIFNERHVRRVPVLRNGELMGVLTRADLIRALADSRRGNDEPSPLDDATIHLRLTQDLGKQSWWQPELASVIVSKGIVQYVGRYELDDDRDAARVLAENVPGVRGVEDHRTGAADGEPMI